MSYSLQHFRSQGHDLHKALGTQFACDRAKDARAERLELVVEKNGGIAIKANQRAIRTTNTLGGTNHHGIVNITLLDATTRRSILDADLDDVTNASIAAPGSTENAGDFAARDERRLDLVGAAASAGSSWGRSVP